MSYSIIRCQMIAKITIKEFRQLRLNDLNFLMVQMHLHVQELLHNLIAGPGNTNAASVFSHAKPTHHLVA